MGLFVKLFGPSRDTLMETLVKESSMEYTMYPDQQFLETLEDFHIFQEGNKKQVKHLFSIQDENKVSVKIFDYKYTIRNSKTETDVWQTLILLTASDINLSHVRISPKGFLAGIEKFFGGQDIEIPYDKAFSENFIVKSAFPEQIHQHLNPQVRELIRSQSDVALEAMNYFVLLNLDGLLKCHVDHYEAYYFHIFKIYEALKGN